ncbi:MAG: undecaprenyl-diphosphate phosphatase [Flavobacteriales bacterium]
MSYFEAFIIALVEGLTEFIPVSSTGHMILAQHLLGVSNSPFLKLFVVNIQLGAILSVVILFWKKFFDFQNPDRLKTLYWQVTLAFIPAAILGFLLSDVIDQLLESPITVGVSLLMGGIILVLSDRFFNSERRARETMKPRQSLIIGCFQCVSMIPGVSRSAATIIGGLSQGLSRRDAAEFSFFLAVPTMLGATILKMKDTIEVAPEIFQSGEHIRLLIFGNVVALFIGGLAIKFFVDFLAKHGMKLFGWYRIVVGIIIIALYISGSKLLIL